MLAGVQIIYQLSIANEQLERDLNQLRQYVLDVRRAARQCGCPLNDSTVLTLYPELHTTINETTASGHTAAAGAAAGAAGAAARTDPGLAFYSQERRSSAEFVRLRRKEVGAQQQQQEQDGSDQQQGQDPSEGQAALAKIDILQSVP